AGGDRRVALWQLGVTKPSPPRARGREGVQHARARDLPAAPKLQPLSAWDEMVADYATTGLTASTHPIGLLRPRLHAAGAIDIGALARTGHGTEVRVGGLVVARQRPGTANGITFLLLEDEHGTVNVIVSPQIYERERLTVRTEPLVVVEGRLERHASAGGAINIVARAVRRLEAGDHVAAQVKDFSLLDAIELARRSAMQEFAAAAGGGLEELAATGTDDFRAVAPPVMNFGTGRSR
ncbi:MAG TPA: OB-fold nucleic acid binding domain-containing protein, partial [Solirubrobacteraceae bacterium]|nr:OB-fold nucleic acid binding domain-containing protein [Solirubrobacteraceae bacterium]